MHKKDAAQYYRESVNDADKDELMALVYRHLGTIHGNNLKAWVQAAFVAGRAPKSK